jgi:hypothetical protein
VTQGRVKRALRSDGRPGPTAARDPPDRKPVVTDVTFDMR